MAKAIPTMLAIAITGISAGAATVVEQWGPGKDAAHPETIALPADPAAGGEIVIDLTALPKGRKVHAARLLMQRRHVVLPPVKRGEEMPPTPDDALKPVEVYLGKVGEGKPLAIIGPWMDGLDATAAVAAAAAGKLTLAIKPLGDWVPGATRLEVVYDRPGGEDVRPAPQAGDVKCVHRAGQTFITWKEVQDLTANSQPEVEWVPQDAFTWAQYQKVRAAADAKRRIRYSIYRHGKPVTGDNLHQAERIAVVEPLSGWNVGGANSERPIDLALANKYANIHGHWNPFADARVEGDWGKHCPLDRFVVPGGDGKPLPSGTGLYVHTATEKTEAYYAVIVNYNGSEHVYAMGPGSAPARPVAETPAEPEPVLQGELPATPFWSYPGKRLHYVRWLAPPYTNLPSGCENFAVCLPAGLGDDVVPLELNLHKDDRSYWRTDFRVERNSIVLKPYDWPEHTWWYGHHEARGTLKSFSEGVIAPYTERRVLWLMDWVAKRWPVDPDRVLIAGVQRHSGGGGASSGSGISPPNACARLSMRYPQRFNLAFWGYNVTPDWRAEPPANLIRLWGDPAWKVKTDTGRSVWDELDLLRIVREMPSGVEPPMATFSTKIRGGSAEGATALTNLMLDRHMPIMFQFNYWPGPSLIPISATGLWPSPMIRMDLSRSKPLPAFAAMALRKHKEMLARIPAEDAQGTDGDVNRYFRWSDEVIDTPERLEMTIWAEGRWGRGVTSDVAIRRIGKLNVKPGAKLAWTFAAEGAEAQSGEIAVGNDGVPVVPGLNITEKPGKLVLTPKR